MRWNELAYAAVYAKEHATPVSLSSPDHGPRHWRDVARIAHVIQPVEANGTLLFLFACIHDTQREDEFNDPEHGPRAAALARHMRANKVIQMDDDLFDQLQVALRDHDKGKRATAVGTSASAAWDADRLTMERVGHTLDPVYFSLDKVRDDLAGYGRLARMIWAGDDQSWDSIAQYYERGRVPV